MVKVIVDKTKEARIIANRSFVKRLREACDGVPECPPDHGRQKWVLDHYNEIADEGVSSETMRKWFHGESRPARSRLTHLAGVVHANPTWLEMGVEPDGSLRDGAKRKVVFDGAVHVLAGFIKLGGGKVVFPDPDRPSRRVPEGADMSVAISDELYHFRVSLARDSGASKIEFVTPSAEDGLTVIGVVPMGPLRADFLHLAPDLIAKHGARKGGFVEVSVSKREGRYMSGRDEWRKIRSFAERL